VAVVFAVAVFAELVFLAAAFFAVVVFFAAVVVAVAAFFAGAFLAGAFLAAAVTEAVDCVEALARAATVRLRLGLLTVVSGWSDGWSAGTQGSFPYNCGAFLEDRVARGQRPRAAPGEAAHRQARRGDTP
jgi:hypothetical protein